MSKVRLPAIEIHNRRIIANIKSGMEMTHTTPSGVALAGRMAKQTLYERYKHPEQFRVCELRGIAKKLDMSVAELLGEQKLGDTP